MSELDAQQEPQETAQETTVVALPGHRLRLTREQLHLSKEEVAHHLHLDVQVVNALESDNYERLPSAAYVCGYLRSYARLLKLPEKEIVNAYSKGQEIHAAIVPENIAIKTEKRRNPVVFKAVASLLVIALTAVGLMWLAEQFQMFDNSRSASISTSLDLAPLNSDEATTDIPTEAIARPDEVQQQIQQYNAQADISDSEKITPPVAAPAPEAVPELTQQKAEATSTTGELKLQIDEDSWVEVTDADAQRHVYKLVHKGTELVVNGVAPYVILLGNADGVTVYYKGEVFNHKRFQRDQIAYFRVGKKQE